MSEKLFLILLLVFTTIGCDSNYSVPLERVEEPVAYVSHPDAGSAASRSERELMLLNAATGTTWRLTSDWANDRQPTWSPSGTHLMFISGRNPDGHGPIRPWPVSTGINRLFVYDLKDGIVRHVDLSWARTSGPMRAQESEGSMRSLGWLECAAWSPTDTTKVAIGVTVRGPHWKDPDKKEDMVEVERRIVLLDLEARTGRLLTTYTNPSCHGLFWAPDGKHLGVFGAGEIDYLRVGTGEVFTLQGDHVRWGGELQYVPLDWGPKGDHLLVRGYSREVDSLAVYEYNVRTEAWSSSLAVLANTARVQKYVPRENGDPDGDFIVLRSSEESFYDDLWRYRLPEGKHERLTDDRMPKLDVVSYHGRKEKGQGRP